MHEIRATVPPALTEEVARLVGRALRLPHLPAIRTDEGRARSRDQAIDMLRLTSRASELFLQQPAVEQRRLLQTVVEKAAWKDGALQTALFEPFEILRHSNQESSRKEKDKAGSECYLDDCKRRIAIARVENRLYAFDDQQRGLSALWRSAHRDDDYVPMPRFAVRHHH